MADYESIRQILKEQFSNFDNWIKNAFCGSEVKEEFELMKHAIHTRIRSLEDGNQHHFSSLKLRFRNRISGPLLTSNIIEGDGHTKIEVELIDETTGEVVDYGPEASARLNVVVLKGEIDNSEEDDWTTAEFNDNIIGDIPGKGPFLDGNLSPRLQRGVCSLGDIKFRNHTIKVKQPFFRLGARVVQAPDEVRIREAKTNSFTVKDYRKKYKKKHDIPALSDDLWRLYNVAKDGPVYNRLRENNILNVEDFLIRLLRDSDGLKKIFVLGELKWKKTVNQVAQACPGDKLYYYENSQKKGIAFNVHGKLQRLYSPDSEVNMLHENHKAEVHEMLASAFKHWDATVFPFDNEVSLKKHLLTRGKKVYSSNHLGGGLEKTGETEMMIGESSQSLQPTSSLNIMMIPSAVNLQTLEAGDFVGIDGLMSTDDNMEITEMMIGESSQSLQPTSSLNIMMIPSAVNLQTLEAGDFVGIDGLMSTDDNMEITHEPHTEQFTPEFLLDTEPNFPVSVGRATSYGDDSNDVARWLACLRWRKLYVIQHFPVLTSISVKKRKLSNEQPNPN